MGRLCHFVASFLAVIAWLSACDAQAGAAMWVYKTKPLMSSARDRDALFTFCHERDITDLFWQVHFDRDPEGDLQMGDAELTRPFLKEAHSRGVRIHALAGDPSHALASNRNRVLARVDALVAFNKSTDVDADFAGLHLDIEPHGLAEWKSADNGAKCELLTQFVDVHVRAAARLHAADPHLVYGADIVFWLDKLKPDGSPVYPVTYKGVRKDAAKHLLDHLDHVAIMSYRNTAEGRNGIVALVSRTIAYADTTDAKVYVGVKMADIGPPLEGFFGRTEEEMMDTLKPVEEAYGTHKSYAGLAFFMYEAFKSMPRARQD